MNPRDYMHQIFELFETANDADKQAEFMQAVLMFTAAFLSSAEDTDAVDEEVKRYVTALLGIIKLRKYDMYKKQTGRFDA